MNNKIIIIIILILILFTLNIFEPFNSNTTYYLINDTGTEAISYSLRNYIYTSSSVTDIKTKNLPYFRNLYEPFGQHFFIEDLYSSQELPKFILESNKECPILYNLYKGLEKLDEFGRRDELQIENSNGINFRTKLQSRFYNINTPITMEFQLFNLYVQEKQSLIDNKPQIKFRIGENNNSKIFNKINTDSKSIIVQPNIYLKGDENFPYINSKDFITIHPNFQLSFDLSFGITLPEGEINLLLIASFINIQNLNPNENQELNSNDNELIKIKYFTNKKISSNSKLGQIKTSINPNPYFFIETTNESNILFTPLPSNKYKVIVTAQGNIITLEIGEKKYYMNSTQRLVYDDVCLLVDKNYVSNLKYKNLGKSPNNNLSILNKINTDSNLIVVQPNINLDGSVVNKNFPYFNSKDFITIHPNFQLSFDLSFGIALPDTQTKLLLISSFININSLNSSDITSNDNTELLNILFDANNINFKSALGEINSLINTNQYFFIETTDESNILFTPLPSNKYKVIVTALGNIITLEIGEKKYYMNSTQRLVYDDVCLLVDKNYVSNLKYKNLDNLIKYIDDKAPISSFNNKESTFGVQENFKDIDLLKFSDFCFTTLTWGAIHIDLMKFVNHHYYVFPCQNPNCSTGINTIYFYTLPARIRQICLNENKNYTRAKCNKCASNIIVYFNSMPSIFKNLNVIEKDKSLPKLI